MHHARSHHDSGEDRQQSRDCTQAASLKSANGGRENPDMATKPLTHLVMAGEFVNIRVLKAIRKAFSYDSIVLLK